MSKKTESLDRLSFETSFCYWKTINQNLQAYADIIEREVKMLAEVMPDSQSYWEMNSQLADARSVAEAVEKFVYPHIVNART